MVFKHTETLEPGSRDWFLGLCDGSYKVAHKSTKTQGLQQIYICLSTTLIFDFIGIAISKELSPYKTLI